MDKITIHRNVCDSVHDLYERKNSDYGDSFAITRERIPNAILVRLWDKLLRLETLMLSGSQKVQDESIEDTMFDLANYCLMELTERIADRQKMQSKK